jgi:hypothetical protein
MSKAMKNPAIDGSTRVCNRIRNLSVIIDASFDASILSHTQLNTHIPGLNEVISTVKAADPTGNIDMNQISAIYNFLKVPALCSLVQVIQSWDINARSS